MSRQDSVYDVIVVGTGVAGIYMLYRLRELGVRVTALEQGDGPGGTWYWNRYPGARFDSESYSYGYSFSDELLEEWDWSEHFAGQPETLAYLNYVIDKFDLRTDMQFGCQVVSCTFREEENLWEITLQDDRILLTRFLVAALGMLSAPTLPRIEGIESFQGRAFHTHDWPREHVELHGLRVAIIGTGATAVQVIPEIASKVAKLTVFQRRPNWCAPLHNGSIDQETMETIRASYREIFDRCNETPGGFIHGPDYREFDEQSREEKLRLWELLYNSPGFGVWLANFVKVLMDPGANAEYSAFIADKIRERVHDPEIVDKLVPKDHGFGARRVPLETNYYETFNRENVCLVDVNETPIQRITRKGIETSECEYEFDLIIYATGFDAITGAYDRIVVKGRNGHLLREKWGREPNTYLGLQTSDFPNFVTLAGPQSASVGTNFPRGIEDAVDWITNLIQYMREHEYVSVEPNVHAVNEWSEHVKTMYDKLLVKTTTSWFTGYNSNIDGYDNVRHLVYFGGAPEYRRKLQEVASKGYPGFEFG